MVRKLASDVVRFGDASTIEESMYDHPFQWGSKRTGPDLARVGRKYPDLWHYRHMRNPRDVVPQSIMPSYPWLLTRNLDTRTLRRRLSVLKRLGVPYDDRTVAEGERIAAEQARGIAESLRSAGVDDEHLENREIVALIAYLQALGRNTSRGETAAAAGGR